MEVRDLYTDLHYDDRGVEDTSKPYVIDLDQVQAEEQQALRPGGQEIYNELESKNWAPWLRFSAEDLDAQASVFPAGQMFTRTEQGVLAVALSTNRISWDGRAESAPAWDTIAGESMTYAETYQPDGNTLTLMSMNVNPVLKGRGYASSIFDSVRHLAETENIERIAADFRPSGFGSYKQATGKFDIDEYAKLTRDDGQPKDPWLRSVTRQGADIMRSHERAMVVEATAEDVDLWSQTYNSDRWWEVTDVHQKHQLLRTHKPYRDLERVDQVLECGETGTWYVDRENNKAVYVESNMWAEIPKEPPMPEILQLPAVDHYHLPESQVKALERELVSAIKTEYTTPDVYAAWITPDHRFADAVRTLEARQFPEMPDLVNDSVEKRSVFMVLVDTREGEDRIVHCTRLSGIKLHEDQPDQTIEGSGFIVIDEAIEKNELSSEGFQKFCEKNNLDPTHFISVETNFRVGEKVPDRDGLRMSDIGYVTFFRKILDKGGEINHSGVFASINIGTRKSLGAIGVKSILIPVESTTQKAEDQLYELVAIPASSETSRILTELGQFVTVKETTFEY